MGDDKSNQLFYSTCPAVWCSDAVYSLYVHGCNTFALEQLSHVIQR